MHTSSLVRPGLCLMHACRSHACYVPIHGRNHLLPVFAVRHLPIELGGPQRCMPPGLQTHAQKRKGTPHLSRQVTSHALAVFALISLTGCLL